MAEIACPFAPEPRTFVSPMSLDAAVALAVRARIEEASEPSVVWGCPPFTRESTAEAGCRVETHSALSFDAARMASLPIWARIQIVGLRDEIQELTAGRNARITALESEVAQLRADLAKARNERDALMADAVRERRSGR